MSSRRDGAGQEVRPRPENVMRARLPGQPALAPGSPLRLAVAVQTASGPERVTSRVLRIHDRSGEAPEAGEQPVWSDTSPCFSPAGKDLAFLSTRADGRQIWLGPASGDPVRLSGFEGSVRAIGWVSARHLAAVVDLPFEPVPPGEPRRIDWLRFKEEGQAGPGRPESVLYRMSCDGRAELMTRPNARIGVLATSPAGTVAYTVHPTRPDSVSDACSVYVMPADEGEPRLAWVSPTPVEALALSSDASALVALAAPEGRYSAGNRRLWLIRSGAATPLFPDMDLSCEYAVSGDLRSSLSSARLAFVPESDTLVFAATDGFDSALHAAPIGSRTASRLTPPGHCVTDFTVSRDHLAFCAETPTHPLEVYVAERGAGTGAWQPPRQITSLNAGWAGGLDLAQPEEHEVTTREGHPMHGLLYRPRSGAASPLVIRVHGGPHLCSGHGFHLEAQIEASRGYAVLLPNLRGSAGWGEWFCGLSVGEWGRGDHDDLLRWVAHARSLPGVDGAALFLAGGSYGGYLVNWTIAHTREFRGAISERAVCNLVSKYGTSDNGFTTNRHEMGGLDVFEEEGQELLRRSPLIHARAVTTPILLLHGESDQRVPIEQSEEWFVALRRLGVDATFWRWPGEGHDMVVRGRPGTRVRRLQIITEWLDAHR